MAALISHMQCTFIWFHTYILAYFPYVMIMSSIWHTLHYLHIINPNMQSFILWSWIPIYMCSYIKDSNHASFIIIIHWHISIYIHIWFEVTHLITMVNTEIALDPAHNLTLRVLYNAIHSIYYTLDALYLYAYERWMQTLFSTKLLSMYFY